MNDPLFNVSTPSYSRPRDLSGTRFSISLLRKISKTHIRPVEVGLEVDLESIIHVENIQCFLADGPRDE